MFRINLVAEYQIGSIVYVITDLDQKPRVVSGYSIMAIGSVMGVNYNLSCEGEETVFYSFEISSEKTIF